MLGIDELLEIADAANLDEPRPRAAGGIVDVGGRIENRFQMPGRTILHDVGADDGVAAGAAHDTGLAKTGSDDDLLELVLRR